MKAIARGYKTIGIVHPLTQQIVETYNLLQIGFSQNINELEYFEAQYLLHFKDAIDKEEQRKMEEKTRRK